MRRLLIDGTISVGGRVCDTGIVNSLQVVITEEILERSSNPAEFEVCFLFR